MGGRKSYSDKDIIGNLRKVIPERKKLSSAIKSESPQGIVQATVDIFNKSEAAISNLSKVFEMRDFIDGISKRKLRQKDIEKEAAKYLSRKKKQIKASQQIKRLLIDSAVKSIKERGGK